MSKNCVFSPSGRFLDIFQTFFRHFSDILSTFPFSGLSNDLPITSLDTLVKEARVYTGVLTGDDEVMQRALEQSPRELVGLRVSLLSGRCCHDIVHLSWDSRHDVLRIWRPFLSGHLERGRSRRGPSAIPNFFVKLQSSALLQWIKGGKPTDKEEKQSIEPPPPKKKQKNSNSLQPHLHQPLQERPPNYGTELIYRHLLDALQDLETAGSRRNVKISAGSHLPL